MPLGPDAPPARRAFSLRQPALPQTPRQLSDVGPQTRLEPGRQLWAAKRLPPANEPQLQIRRNRFALTHVISTFPHKFASKPYTRGVSFAWYRERRVFVASLEGWSIHMGKRGPRPLSLEHLQMYEDFWLRFFKGDPANPTERGKQGLPPELRKKLIETRSPKKVRRICQKFAHWRWGIPRRAIERCLRETTSARQRNRVRRLEAQEKANAWLKFRNAAEGILYYKAKEFVDAKKSKRYPASSRPSSEEKKLLFLSRWLAGISVGRAGETALRRKMSL